MYIGLQQKEKYHHFFKILKIIYQIIKKKNIKELIEIFNNKYLNNLENYHSINEILDYYNLNRFDKFNFNKRYVIKEKNNIVFIKILFSDINNWDIILSKIFNKNIKIYSANLTKNKNNIYSLYEKFKKEYKIPKSYINKELKNDIEFQIYNKKSEQEYYKKKWLLKSY